MKYDDTITELDLTSWVSNGPIDRLTFRQAVHVVIYAISNSNYLKHNMIMKGGMLLAIRYGSCRYTEDIDFSTILQITQLDENKFKSEFNDALSISSDELPYNLSCAVQSIKKQPKQPKTITYPSFNLSIGYARKSNANEIARLNNNQCTNVVRIDYSFNEATYNVVDLLISSGDGSIKAYGFLEIIAEKYRSIIQQIYRKRNRRQDVYDLFFLLKNTVLTDKDKEKLLLNLIQKSQGRLPDKAINKFSLENSEIREASMKEYFQLKLEIIGELPDFDDSYEFINQFYQQLPWSMLKT